MLSKTSILSVLLIGTLISVGCGGDSGPTSAGPMPPEAGLTGGTGSATFMDTPFSQEEPPTAATVGEILANPSAFMGKEVGLKGRITGELESGRYLFDDVTGDIPVRFDSLAPPPPMNEQLVVFGKVVGGGGGYAARIDAYSWAETTPFSCDDILDVRARFTDPGFRFGNVVGYYLAFRGSPPGEKILEVRWDDGNPHGEVEEAYVGQGGLVDGLYNLEGVVTHEYTDIRSEKEVSVRAILKIAGREGGCNRVRQVTVTPGDGPDSGGGGTISVTIDEERIESGDTFHVRGKVDNKSTLAADVDVLFQTPEDAKIHPDQYNSDRCEVIDSEFVQCPIDGLEPGERLTRVVKYIAPTVSSTRELKGAVGIVSGEFTPVAKYKVIVHP